MNDYKTGEHPIEQNLQRIKEEGIVVVGNVSGLPYGENGFVSPDYVICIGHRGRIDMMYDDMPDYSEAHTVAVIYPNHRLRTVSHTDDYRATLIIAHASQLNDPMLQAISQLRYRYEPHPNVKLDKHQYRMIMNIVELMQETSNLGLAERRVLQQRQLEYLLRLLGFYRRKLLNETDEAKRVSNQFYHNLSQHFREHRDVGFYAALACLSPKYFSDVVKQETGYNAAHWIHTRVVTEAKMLLHTRRDLSVQAIADLLGFVDQATFSRYFRREAGQSPTDFREAQEQLQEK